jgi:RNA polymerase sigma-70 factor, ECF subfamily
MAKKQNDFDLVKQLKAGHPAGMETLIQRYANKALSLASRLTRNPQDAEEVLQDVFVTVFRKIHAFEGKSSFSSWLYRITVNAALMKLRKRRQDHSVLMEDALPDFKNSIQLRGSVHSEGESYAQRNELSMVLEQAIRMLPDDYRPVFVLRDIDGLTSREVGKILELTTPAVKSRLHRSRLMIRKRLLPFYREYRYGDPKSARSKSVGNL